MTPQPEAFSRVLIDRALADSGWDLLNPKQIRFELHGAGGRADYVLCSPRGPICVLEAKNEDAAQVVNHDSPVDILNEVLKLENEIIRRGNELLRTLGGSK